MSTGPVDLPIAGRTSARLLDLELHDQLEKIIPTTTVGDQQTWLLVRLFGEILGRWVVDVPISGLTTEAIADGVSERWGAQLAERLGSDVAQRFTEGSLTPLGLLESAHRSSGTPYTAAHAEYLTRAPRIAVAICTRNRPDDLRRCVETLVAQDHPNFVVWIVDNGPGMPGTREVAEEFVGRLDIRYVPEPIPGLSRARNTVLAQDLEADVLAWLDDDTVADPWWLSELARGFDGRPDVSAVSGPVVPGELDTAPQLWCEEFGGQTKGRGFTRAEFSPRTAHIQSPYWPTPPVGVGANMAFRVDVLRRFGFDEALGAGSRSQGCEDTMMFALILRNGGTVVYLPTPLTRHFHRRDYESLLKQMKGYGSGLTAFYTALVVDHPTVVFPLARLSARALREVFSESSDRHASISDTFPRELLAANRRGMAEGPYRYLRQRAENWRDRKHRARG
jgi:glycosyltransferase involved in cell wall biosynthesis